MFFQLDNIPTLRASGKDAVRYLHGRLTQNVKDLAIGDSAGSLVLTPQGRVEGHLTIQRRADDVILLSDPLKTSEDLGALIAAILQFKVADQIVIEDLEATVFHAVGIDHERLSAAIPFQIAALIHDRGLGAGIDLLVSKERAEETKTILQSLTQQESLAVLEQARIISGQPVWGAEIERDTLAPDLPLERLVSFNKGCYAGQEVVEMATARGRPNRTLVKLLARAPLERGASITTTPDPDHKQKAVGEITSVTELNGDSLLLAFVKTAAAHEHGPLFAGAQELERR